MKHVLICCTLMALIALSMPASANWSPDGFPLEGQLVANGTIHGSIYVGGGHGKTGQNLSIDPYTELFDLPPGNITFARLYTGGMLGWADGVGVMNMTLNGEPLGDITFRGMEDTNPNVYFAASGYTAWVYYDVTDEVTAGTTNNATLRTENIYHTFNKYIYGLVLVAVYEDPGKPEIQYWIREGVEYLSPRVPDLEANVTFPGTVNEPVEGATLWTVAIMGHEGGNDTLWFNDQQVCTGLIEERNGDGLDINATNVTAYMQSSGNKATYYLGEESAIYFVNSILVIGKPEEDPNLAVLDISAPVLVNGANTFAVVANHAYTVDATIYNKGTGTANATNAELRVDGVLVDQRCVPSLAIGETVQVTFNWTPDTYGTQMLNVTVDPENLVNESIEYNNFLTKEVYVYQEGEPDLTLSQSDITILPTRDSNDTTIRVIVTNNGTGDAATFKVGLAIDGSPVGYSNVSVTAKATNTTEFAYPAAHLSTHEANITLDMDDTISESDEGNNCASDDFSIIEVRTLATIGYHNDTMFDIVKLVPKNATPVEVLMSVADVYYDGYVVGINGINTSTTGVTKMWGSLINGLYYSSTSGDYHLRDGELVYWRYVSGFRVGSTFIISRPVRTYPEPFLHGFDGVVPDTTVVYPSGYDAIAASIMEKLKEYGVANVTTVLLDNLTNETKEENNLILLGTPSENSIIADICPNYYLIGLPVYFDEYGLMHDVETGNVYGAGGVLVACDNPFDNPPEEDSNIDTGPSIWIASGVNSGDAQAAANLLLAPEVLDEFWKFVSPSEVMKGDLNRDDDITTADAVIALQMAAGSRTPDIARGDVSGDDMVTSLDALMIMQAAAGSINL